MSAKVQSNGRKLALSIPADPKQIDRTAETIMRTVQRMDASHGKEFDIDLAVREALANAIIHGCGCDPAKKIAISVSAANNGDLLINVRDPGPGFDHQSLPDPCEGNNLYRPNGRGIHLITELMDEVEFAPLENGAGMEVRMKMKKH